MILKFPPVETANEHGLLAVGGDLEPESLLLAYRSGIFPWPVSEDDELLWFCPPKRAVLPLANFHLSRSLQRVLVKTPFDFKVNQNCKAVIEGCQQTINRPRQQGTWITDEMKAAYLELHRRGIVHSFECYLEDKLVGGVYGVSIGGTFAAESMFYRYSNASNAILWILGQFLFAHGAVWIDCQIMNPHLASLGAVEIPREEFLKQHALMVSYPQISFTNDRLDALLASLEILKKPELHRTK